MHIGAHLAYLLGPMMVASAATATETQPLPSEIETEIESAANISDWPTPSDVVESRLARLSLAFALTQTQEEGFRGFLLAFPAGDIAVDGRSGLPSHITGIWNVSDETDPQKAVSAFLQRHGGWLAKTLRLDDLRSLFWDVSDLKSTASRTRVRLQRLLDGVPVEDDAIVIRLARDGGEKRGWAVTGVDVHWTTGLPEAVALDWMLGENDIEAAVQSIFLTAGSRELVIATRYAEAKGRLVLRIEGVSARGEEIVWLDAVSGNLLASVSNSPSYNYSGVLKAPVTLPFEPAEFPKSCLTTPSSNCHPLPFAPIYDSTEWRPVNQDIDQLGSSYVRHPQVYVGRLSNYLGTTDYEGLFQLVNAGDTSIYVDQSKRFYYEELTNDPLPYAFDRSNYASGPAADLGQCRDDNGMLYECSSPYFHTPITIDTLRSEQYAERNAGSVYDMLPNFLRIRQEIFFHLSYAGYNLDWWDIPVYRPVKFLYHRASGVNGFECGGVAHGLSVRYWCGALYDNSGIADNCKEIGFRGVLYHEFGHTVFNRSSSLPDGYYGHGNVYHEAASTVSELLLSRFEGTFPDGNYVLGAQRTWPMPSQDDEATVYRRAGVFNSIFLDLALMTGYLSMPTIYNSFAEVASNTVMVGRCTNVRDPATCNGNSFYQRLVAAARNFWFLPEWGQDYEVSRAFHSHVEDAVPYEEEPRCGPSCECDLTCDPGYNPECAPPCNNVCDAGCVINPAVCPPHCETALFWDPGELAVKDDFAMFDDVTNLPFAAALFDADVPTATGSVWNTFPTIQLSPDPSPRALPNQQLWFSNSSDIDVFAVYLRAGLQYLFYGFGTGTLPCMKLRSENLATLAISTTCSGSGSYAVITYSPATDGLYLLQFSPAPSVSQFGPAYTYRYYVYSGGDDYAEELDRATPMPHGFIGSAAVDVPGRFNGEDDIDTLYFYRVNPGTAQLSITSSDTSIAFLLDKEGVLLGLALNNGTPATINLPASGRYHVQTYGNGDQNYVLRLATNDEDLGGNGTTSALELAEGDVLEGPRVDSRYEVVRANLASTADKDYFEFVATRGDVMQVLTSHLGTGVDTIVHVYPPVQGFQEYQNVCPRQDSLQLELLRDDDGGVPGDRSSRLMFVAPVTGTFLIEVTSKDTGSPGPYSLELLRRTDSLSSSLAIYTPRFPGE